MNLTNQNVIHKLFGEGTVIEHSDKYITISFSAGEKKFPFPDSFNIFLSIKDRNLAEQIETLLKEKEAEEAKKRALWETEQKREMEQQQKIRAIESRTKKPKIKTYPRANIAFKCNFCDGGKSDKQVGFNGVCSDKLIYNNIAVEKRTWCTADECPCLQYYNRALTRRDLDEQCKNGGFVCYESQMLRDWKALAGVVQNGKNKGKPMKLKNVKANSLCVLTTRDPQSIEENRYIFAVFLVDETYEGDGHEEGYVSTNSQYKMILSPKEAHSLLFWNYHANENKPEVAVWSSGLHRYFEDEQAAQILRDIAKIKASTDKGQLAIDFYEYFCKINGVDSSTIGEPCGAFAYDVGFCQIRSTMPTSPFAT
jgi:hypothetical protein